MADIPVIAFGPNEDSFYVGVGMRYFAPNTPETMQGTISKWPAIQIRWMSIEADGRGWVAKDAYSSAFEYSNIIPDDVIAKLNRSSPPEYVSFGSNKGNWCAVIPGANWCGDMENKMIEQMREIRDSIGVDTFDSALEGVLFGKGTTMIFLYKNAFSCYTDKDAEGSKLETLLNDYIYRQPPWKILRGSSLCFYNIDYYFLKFKDPQSDTVRMHWNLPPGMDEKLAELRESQATPEAKLAIQNHENFQLNMAVSRYALLYKESELWDRVGGGDNWMPGRISFRDGFELNFKFGLLEGAKHGTRRKEILKPSMFTSSND